MQHVLVFGNERLEQGQLLASVTADQAAMDFTGYLSKEARFRVLSQAAAMKRARDFEWFELVYPATADKCARSERWEFESNYGSQTTLRFTVQLKDGRTLCQTWAVAHPEVFHIDLCAK